MFKYVYMCLQKNGLTALHIAVALPGEDGVNIAQLLLNSLADPDARAVQDDSFLNTNLVSFFNTLPVVLLKNMLFVNNILFC